MVALPTEKQQPAIDGLLYRRILLAGQQKIGKTTTGLGFTERPLVIDAEGSAESYECFRVACPDWMTLRQIGAELARDPERGGFTCLQVDTIDELARQCQEAVIGHLAGQANDVDAGQYAHPSDFEYGKGWGAVTEEFRVRVARLCSLGLPVLFISHEKDREVEDRTGKRIVYSPDVGNKGMRTWLLGFVDAILRATVVSTPEGDRHVIIAKPSPDNVVGVRTPPGGAQLPPQFSLSGEALYKALSMRAEGAPAPQTAEGEPEQQQLGGDGEKGIEFRKPEGGRTSRTGGRSRSGKKAA